MMATDQRMHYAPGPRDGDDGSVVLRIVSFDPLAAGRSDWERFHTYRQARRAASDPDEPVISDAEVEEEERQRHPHVIRLRWLALECCLAISYRYMRFTYKSRER
jgi:hypothetical protein